MSKAQTNKAIKKSLKRLKQRQRSLDLILQMLKAELEQLHSGDANPSNKD